MFVLRLPCNLVCGTGSKLLPQPVRTKILLGPVVGSKGTLLNVFLLEPWTSYQSHLLMTKLVAYLPKEAFPFGWDYWHADWQWDMFYAESFGKNDIACVDALYELPGTRWELTGIREPRQPQKLVLSLLVKQDPSEINNAVLWLLEGRQEEPLN